MRDRVVKLLVEAGFQWVDTNRWFWFGDTKEPCFRIGYSSREWTVSYQDKGQPVRRWRLSTESSASMPSDLLELITQWVHAFRATGAHEQNRA